MCRKSIRTQVYGESETDAYIYKCIVTCAFSVPINFRAFYLIDFIAFVFVKQVGFVSR